MYDPLRAKARVAFFTAVAFLFGLGLASGLGWTAASHAMPTIDEAPQVSEEAVRAAMDLSDAFTSLAESVTPGVVRIETRRPARVVRQEVPEAFRRFFDIPEGEAPPSQGQISGGSGFIVSEDGYILTNNHVVDGADEVRVYLSDGRYFTAEVVGTDPFTDVAVIKISADGLHAMSLGNSDGARVGEWVLAIGNPGFGSSTQLPFTVTAGIISARGRGLNLLNRDLFNDPSYGQDVAGYSIEDFIQTDAVINPGNSGGPMVNLQGQVVGINSAIASTTGVYQGYGFAIPINLARRVMEDLVEFGHVQRPRIGVRIGPVSAEDAEVYELPSVSGVLIQTVEADGPARGLLEPEDVIVALNGEPVGYPAELQAKVAQFHPGDRVELTVYRDGGPRDVTIRLGEAPINEIRTLTAERAVMAEDRLGISLRELTPEVASELGFEEPSGVILTEVVRGSPAQRRGVAGFLNWKLIRVNDTEVGSAEDVREELEAAEAGEIIQLYFEAPEGQAVAPGTVQVVNVRMPG